jgi:hypothetical protein
MRTWLRRVAPILVVGWALAVVFMQGLIEVGVRLESISKRVPELTPVVQWLIEVRGVVWSWNHRDYLY